MGVDHLLVVTDIHGGEALADLGPAISTARSAQVLGAEIEAAQMILRRAGAGA